MRVAGVLVALAVLGEASVAHAEDVLAEPVASIEVSAPEGAAPMEAQVVLQLVVDADGNVESAVEIARAPVSVPDTFSREAIRAIERAKFIPSTRDGKRIRSRIEYIVVFHAPLEPVVAPAPPPPMTKAVSTNEQDEDYEAVRVRGMAWPSQRGLGDMRIKRELLEASPRQHTSEMLSAAPGFFVDHEDGEGLGNDVYLRGFDLAHGSGIEMRVGQIPINIPNHIRGQGYADANFIIPEVVRSIRVLQGPYDPRQGDSAIVGSAYFDLGVEERGYQVKTSYGSFNQTRIVGIAAPKDSDAETFAAFSLRHTDGFGTNREALSGSAMAQYGVDLGARDHLRLLATAYSAGGSLPGVVREDDVNAGKISLDGAYPYFAQGQGVQSARVIFGADFDHVADSGARFELAPYVMWTNFRARQNFTGALETSQTNPSASGLGDLFQTTNRETAAGLTTRFRPVPLKLGHALEIIAEPGIMVRAGHTDQTKSLLVPTTLTSWDRRIDAGLETMDAGAYLDLDLRFRHLRLSGGPRADLLVESMSDRLAGGLRHAAGIAAGPRATMEYEVTPWISPVASYGEGFRSLDAQSLKEGSTKPFSKVRSVEAGLHVKLHKERYTATAAVFETWVANELVFEAEAGGLETERASTRKGFVGSIVAKPFDWLLASSALSFTSARFDTLV
ncbi:MAG: TonB-dependent receptor, partial [Polyangiaceae bacterium]